MQHKDFYFYTSQIQDREFQVAQHGTTALHNAASQGKIKAAEILLKAKANVAAIDKVVLPVPASFASHSFLSPSLFLLSACWNFF